MKLPERKQLRLKNYDYSQNGTYFVTICSQNRLCLFGKTENKEMILNHAGMMVYNKIGEIDKYYPGIQIDKFVVMPNHIHVIMVIKHEPGTTQGSFPTISECIQRFKSLTTKLYVDGVKKGIYPPFDKKIWQKSFHDHIIRNEKEYQDIWEYIDLNPYSWEDDKYYI